MAINDSMAYLFGIAFGRNAMLPTISAKKTWEGFVGAAVSTMFAGKYLLPLENPTDGLILASMASFVGPFGGFLASIVKRAYGQKDFGKVFPGHGGLIDRLDCHVFLAPFVYLYLLHTRPAMASESAGVLLNGVK